MKKKLMMALSLVLVAAMSIGGTIAYLTVKTDPVVNTFTVGNIDITLTESTEDYKMVPGDTIDKDPKVTVKANSEDCWLFVKITESTNLDAFITYAKAEGWTALASDENVWYRNVTSSTADQTFKVLDKDKVTVNQTVSKAMMDALKADDPATTDVNESTYPTLTFTAYAIQQQGFADASAAWAEVSTLG